MAPAGALPDWTIVIGLAPRDADNYIGRARVYDQLGDLDHALADLTTAAGLAAAGWPAYFVHRQQADMLFAHGRFREALAAYRVSLGHLPDVSVAAELGKQFLLGGPAGILLGEFGQTARREQAQVERAQAYLNERIHVSEALVKGGTHRGDLPPLTLGMSHRAVLEQVLVTDRIVGDSENLLFAPGSATPECYVTVSTTGPPEDRGLRVLVFTESTLRATTRRPLTAVPEGPEAAASAGACKHALKSRYATESLVYSDDTFVVTLTASPATQEPWVRVVRCDKDLVMFSVLKKLPMIP
jgi:hypothetical protein